MNTGMLWFDNSNISLGDKIKKAVAYYEKKHNIKPTSCLVHPNDLKDGIPDCGIEIHPYRPVLPGHIWIGVEEIKEPQL